MRALYPEDCRGIKDDELINCSGGGSKWSSGQSGWRYSFSPQGKALGVVFLQQRTPTWGRMSPVVSFGDQMEFCFPGHLRAPLHPVLSWRGSCEGRWCTFQHDAGTGGVPKEKELDAKQSSEDESLHMTYQILCRVKNDPATVAGRFLVHFKVRWEAQHCRKEFKTDIARESHTSGHRPK